MWYWTKLLFLILVGAVLLWLAYEFITFPNTAKLRTENPVLTSMMQQRLNEMQADGREPKKYNIWMPIGQISPNLERAVLAGEDARFFEHQGFDWDAIEAQAFAFLAVRSLRGLPLSVPTTTGVPVPFHCVHESEVADAVDVERRLKAELAEYREALKGCGTDMNHIDIVFNNLQNSRKPKPTPSVVSQTKIEIFKTYGR